MPAAQPSRRADLPASSPSAPPPRPSVTQRLAAEIARSMRAPTISEEARHGAERVLLDSFACALGAHRSEAVEAARRWARRLDGKPQATLYGTGEKSSVLGAAIVNSTMIRDLDLNDTYFSTNPTHASDALGAVIAVAEAEGAPAEALIHAVLVAFEIQMRAAAFTETSYFRVLGWDHTHFITVAVAAAAGLLLKLSETELAHALGIAGCFPVLGGLRAGQISMMKSISAGLTASRGVEAAYLAREGVTGPLAIFEGERGVERNVIGACDWDLFAAPLGTWRLPLTCFKRHPAAYIIHSAIDAALELKRELGFAPADVAEVTVEAFGWLVEDMVHGMGGTSRYEIDRRETADHSLPFCVAAALTDGRYTIRQLDARRWEDADLKAMLAKIRCVHDRGMDARFPAERPSRVTVVLADGTRHAAEYPYPKGDPRLPLSDDDLRAKLASLAPAEMGADAVDRLADCCLDFRNRTVAELTAAAAIRPPIAE
jgi:2-methylcitrate dehydratase